MRKFFISFYIFLFCTVFGASFAHASTSLNAYFFYGDGCPHCAKERAYLETIKGKYPHLEVRSFEVYYNADNLLLLQKIAETLGVDAGGVPFLIIGDKYFIGYGEGITGNEIENRIKECLHEDCSDSVADIINHKTDKNPDRSQKPLQTTTGEIIPEKDITKKQNEIGNREKIIEVPILGDIDVYKLSLPVLTIIMGILDGFNPCAMWVLLFLISLLLGMRDRKRMWILGAAFITTSASVYFIFMSTWLNVILFLGFVVWVRTVIGILALIGGGYSIKEFLLNKDSGCAVAHDERRQKVFQKLKAVIGQNSFWLALCGITALAFMVNLVELICSAGLPAIYTQVLALNELNKWQNYFYILLYVFFFMIDDIFVFVIAMITLEMTGVTTKYVRYSRLVGGLLMLLIGLLLVFKPQWLMFG